MQQSWRLALVKQYLASDVDGGQHDVPRMVIQHTLPREEALQVDHRRRRHLRRKVESPAHRLRFASVEAQQHCLLL